MEWVQKVAWKNFITIFTFTIGEPFMNHLWTGCSPYYLLLILCVCLWYTCGFVGMHEPMWLCVNACACVGICKCIFLCGHVGLHGPVWACVNAWTYVDMCACRSLCRCVWMHESVYAYVYTCAYVGLYVCMCLCGRVCMYLPCRHVYMYVPM